jgi:glutaredoxin
MYQELEFVKEDGSNQKYDITVFALSTCGFCRRGLQFLRENKIKFKYIYVDKMDFEVKEKVKTELQEKFKERVVFPYLVLNDTEVLTGFIEEKWKEVFGV